MNIFERNLRKLDAFQQESKHLSFVYGVIKKYGDDNGGSLAVQLTYSLLTTIFPLMLLLITILSLVLAGDPSIRADVLRSTFSQFPVVGSQLSSNIHVLRRDSIIGLIVGLLGLIYGSTGLAGTGLYVMEQVWNVEGPLRPNFIKRLGRGLTFLVVLGLGLIITTALSGFGTYGRHNFWLGLIAEILAVAVNVGLYMLAYRVLTPKHIKTDDLIKGAILAGIMWTILQAFGGYLVGHDLRNDNATYGVFGTVLGLIAWLYISAEITIYAAEVNAVLKRHLWPRGMIQPPLTKADQVSIAYQATQNQRRPEQSVMTTVRGKPTGQAAYLKNGKLDNSKIGTTRKVPKRAKARK